MDFSTSTRKKVYFNGRFLLRPRTGVDRFALETLRALHKLLESSPLSAVDISFFIVIPKALDIGDDWPLFKVIRVGGIGGVIWEQTFFRLVSRDGLAVNLCNSGILWRFFQLIVLHDAATFAVPSSYGWRFRLWYRFLIPSLFKVSISVCSVSKFSADDLQRRFGCKSNLLVLGEGVDHILELSADASSLERFGVSQRPYFLAVSSLAPHKNFTLVVNAIKQVLDPKFDFVIAGGTNPKIFAGEKSLPLFVKHVGFVTDHELKALYQNALCFVFPSVFEGYGLPPTEAMACGCPVIASDIAVLREVCGDAVLYFDPYDSARLSDLMIAVFQDERLRHELRMKGYEQTRSMRWSFVAEKLVSEIRRVFE